MTADADPTILAVDDEPQNTRLLEAILTAHGFDVTSASSGPEALERLTTDEPDLILLDVDAGMDGLEVCRRLHDEAAFLPVVMLTSH